MQNKSDLYTKFFGGLLFSKPKFREMSKYIRDEWIPTQWRPLWLAMKEQNIKFYEMDEWNRLELTQKSGIEVDNLLDTNAPFEAMILNTYVEQIRQNFVKYKFSSLAQKILKEGTIPETLLEDVINLYSLQNGDEFETLDNVKLKRDEHVNIKSAFSALNDVIYSYQTKRLYTVATRPAKGKTTFLLNEAWHISEKFPVAFFTLEMSIQECKTRLITKQMGIDSRELWSDPAKLEAADYEFNTKHTVLKNGEKRKLYFYQTKTQISFTDLQIKIREMAAKGVKVVFIDQLSHVRHNERARTKTEAIEQTIRMLKSLALELDIAIILAVQLNRDASKEDDFDLHNLKDSGSIEEASDVVMLLKPEKDDSDIIKLTVNVAKNRYGKVGKCDLVWDKRFYRIYSAETVDFGKQKF